MPSKDYTQTERKSKRDTWFSPWLIETTDTADERVFERNSWESAVALQALFEVFENIEPTEVNDGCVPIDVAIEGKPAIATYLLGANDLSPEQVASCMDVERSTVMKYLARFRPDTFSGN